MSLYEISGEAVDLSSLKTHQVNAKLSLLIGTTGKLRCLCVSAKPLMHVSRRGNNYFPVKVDGTGKNHNKRCRHHSLTELEAASMGYTLEALRNSNDDELVVTLTKPLKRRAELVAATSVPFVFSQRYTRRVTNRMTELGLLHLLWERGGLHEHNPGAIVGSPWPTIRRAAYGIRPSGFKSLEHGLSELLLLPLHFENSEQKTWNFAKFKDAQKKNRFLLFVARLNQADVASLLAAETTSFSLGTMFGVSLTLYTDAAKPVLDALKDSFSDELSYSQKDGDDLIVFGIAHPSASKSYATISSMVLMPVVSGHLPYDSRYEKDLALELVCQKRWFKKPLRYDAVHYMQVHPDFVFLDTPVPVVVEVYGMNTQEYRQRKAEKRLIYRSDEYPFACWEWEATECDNIALWLDGHPLPARR